MQFFSEIVAVLLILATIAQCAVWWIGFGIFNRKTEASSGELPPNQSKTPSEPVTIIICARNEAQNLKDNLPAIFSQKYTAAYQVLVVNDASEDDSAAVLEFLSQQYSNLKVLNLVNKKLAGKKGALSAGVAIAETEWIVVTDADCKPASDNWLAGMCAGLGGDADMVLGYGPLREKSGWLNAWARYEVFMTALQYFSFLFWKNPYMGVGRNMAWRKSLYTRTGGFEKHAHIMSGDDDLFVNEAAAKAEIQECLLPDTYMYSDAKTTLRDYFTQKDRHLSTGKFYHWTHRFWLGFAALSHSCHYLFVATLILAQFSMVFVLCFYVIRLVSVILVCRPALRKLKEEKLIPFLPLFDLLLPVFYVVFIPTIFLHKNNKPRSWT